MLSEVAHYGGDDSSSLFVPERSTVSAPTPSVRFDKSKRLGHKLGAATLAQRPQYSILMQTPDATIIYDLNQARRSRARGRTTELSAYGPPAAVPESMPSMIRQAYPLLLRIAAMASLTAIAVGVLLSLVYPTKLSGVVFLIGLLTFWFVGIYGRKLDRR